MCVRLVPDVGMCDVGKLCQADGETLCVTCCPTGLPVDTTSFNTSVCGEKVKGKYTFSAAVGSEKQQVNILLHHN